MKMMPVDVKFSTDIDFGIKTSGKDPKFEVGNHVII